MDAPIITSSGYQAALLSWKDYTSKLKLKEEEVAGYEIQMRENKGGTPWSTIASCLSHSSTQVRKKNLTSHTNGYQFRIRPVYKNTTITLPFSAPSEAFIPPTLSTNLLHFFRHLQNNPPSLLSNPGRKRLSLQEALIDKEFVLLYISAHWCGPCRSYTPQLIQYYNNSLGKEAQNVEVVFCSADHDETGFWMYYNTMPWLAVPFEEEGGREGIMGAVRVKGIPRLVVLDGRSGVVVEENAVGKVLDVGRWRRLRDG